MNIWDDRPDQDYATGAIVDVAKVDPMPKTVGKWNVYEITAKGATFTVDAERARRPSKAAGYQACERPDRAPARARQQGRRGVVNDKGVVKFRKVEIKPL